MRRENKIVMEDIIDRNTLEKDNTKLEKIAFTTMLLALIYVFLKFFNYVFTYLNLTDSVLIPEYSVNYILIESFYSGLILSFGIIITFYLYKIKKYYLVIILNTIFIVQSLALPYILYFVNNY